MSKYCPAGNCECENYTGDVTIFQHQFISCTAHPNNGSGPEFSLLNRGQCPWPIRQKPVVGNEHPISQATVEAVCVTAQNAYDSGFRKGQEEMKGRAVTVLTEKCEVKIVRTFDNNGRITGTGHAVLVEDAIKHINSLEVKGE